MVAGGRGTRMGASCPKQFLQLDGKAILQLTIERFLSADESLKVITVLPKDYIEEWKSYCYDSSFVCPQTLVEGGITRFHSVRNALSKVPDGSIVAIHDGVRPLISRECIKSLFDLAEKYEGVIPVLPCTDTIKVLGKEDECGLRRSDASAKADRSVLFGAQTPQIFHSEIIRKAYSCAYDTSFTDDASVAEAYGIDVVYAKGERTNIKITTPEDLVSLEALVKWRRESIR